MPPLGGTNELEMPPLGGTNELEMPPSGGTHETEVPPLGGTNELEMPPSGGTGEGGARFAKLQRPYGLIQKANFARSAPATTAPDRASDPGGSSSCTSKLSVSEPVTCSR